MEVLKGAAEILDRFKPILFVEIDNAFLARQQTSAKAIFDLLGSHGYKIKNAETGEEMRSGSAISGKHIDIVGVPITEI